MVTASRRSTALANIFGAFGYLSNIMQWLWTIALFLPVFLANETIRNFVTPQQTTDTTTGLIVSTNSVFMIIVAVVVTLAVLIVTAVVIARLPLALVRSSRKTVDTTVEAVLPIVTHHKKLTKKKQRLISMHLRRYVKCILCLLPLMPFAFIPVIELGLSEQLALFVACIFAIVSLVLFSAQYSLAELLRFSEEKLI